MKRIYFLILASIFLIALSSCVSTPTFFNKSSIDRKSEKIAVLPFRDYNIAEGNNSGELVRSLFELRMILKGFKIIEIEKTASNIDYSILKKQEFPGKWIIETGNTLGADYIIYGSVHDYRIYQNMTSFLYIFSWLEVTTSVGVTARMVSCKTGEVVWSGTFTRTSYTFNDAATEGVNALIKTIKCKSTVPE